MIPPLSIGAAVEAEVRRQTRLDVRSRQLRIAVRVEQALLSCHDQAGAVAIDGAAFQNPAMALHLLAPLFRQPLADVVVAGQVVFPAPAVEHEVMRQAVIPDDRCGIAQPDVAEQLDNHLRERRQPPCLDRCLLVRGDKQHLLALAVGVNGGCEGGNLAAGLLKILLPELRMARETDPDGQMGCPFGLGCAVHFASCRDLSRIALNSAVGYQLGQALPSASCRPS